MEEKSLTVNQLLAMQKSLSTRRGQLDELKNSATQRTIFQSSVDPDKRTIQEPTYDIKKVDKKLAAINKALWDIDQSIKESNARTKIKISLDFDILMSEIE